MKRLIIVASIVLWLGCVVATAALTRFARPPADSGLSLLLTSGTTMAIAFTTVILGQILMNRTDPASTTGVRLYRHLGWVCLGGLAVAAVLPIIGGILLQSPVWVPIALIALAIVSSLVPVAAAVRYRRQLPARIAGENDWRVDTDRARTFRRIGITFAIATAVCAGGIGVLAATGADDSLTATEIIAFSAGMGAFCAAVPAVGSALRLNSAATDIFASTDRRTNRKVSRVVVRGKTENLTESQRVMAAEFAHVWRELIPIQIAQTMLFIAGVFLLQLPRILRGDTEPIVNVLFALTGVMMLLLLIGGWYQYRFVRRYSDAHPVTEAA